MAVSGTVSPGLDLAELIDGFPTVIGWVHGRTEDRNVELLVAAPFALS